MEAAGLGTLQLRTGVLGEVAALEGLEVTHQLALADRGGMGFLLLSAGQLFTMAQVQGEWAQHLAPVELVGFRA